MQKTLLAVDDSVTMRKVLEITFSGEDFRVITAESAQAALGKLGENPAVFVVDTVLGGDDGYALVQELRKRSPDASIVMLASRHAPYDQSRGRDVGADDWADKPFDTQQLIDKVRKVMIGKGAGGSYRVPVAPQAGGAPQSAPYRAPAPPQAVATISAAGGGGRVGPAMPPPGVGARSPQPAGGGPGGRTGTLMFGEGGAPAAAQGAAGPAPAPAPPRPAQGGAPASPPFSPMATTSGVSAGVGAAINGHLAGKLGDLGLTPQQADAVLALSRSVVERVVWEVVPTLAETMIKEELRRLMKE